MRADVSAGIGNTGARANLFVPEAVRRSVEPPDVQAVWLYAGDAAGHHNLIAWLECRGRDADGHELEAIVHLEPPLLDLTVGVLDIDEEKGMWVDELELGDSTFDRQPPAAVVHARN